MNLTGLPNQLVGFLSRNHTWHAKGTLTADMTWHHQVGQRYGKRYLPETVGRTLRHLEEDSIIAVKPDGISVAYKWLPPVRRKSYIPMFLRPIGKSHILFKEQAGAVPQAYKD